MLYGDNSSHSKLCAYTISKILIYKENMKLMYIKPVFDI